MVRAMIAVAAVAGLAAAVQANPAVTFTGNAGARAAQADFSVSGSNLVVRLTNTATADVMVPSDVLTAVFFDISGPAIGLSRISGVLAAGSQVFYDPDGQPAGGVIGGEWAYLGGLNVGQVAGRRYGISSTGLGVFGPGNLFPGADLKSPASPNGLEYGLLSAGDNPATGNGGVTGSGGLIKNSVVFTLGGVGTDFDLGRIGSVYFLYGTAFGEGAIGGEQVQKIPGAGSALLAGLGLLAASRRRR
jgi:hypothetical protein